MRITNLQRRTLHLRARWSFLAMGCGVALGTAPLALAPMVANAADPTNVSFSLLGCKGSESLVSATSPYVCPDADYTGGSLGVNWHDLDIVPMRLVAQAGNNAPASQAYDIAITAGYSSAGKPGFDDISVPVLNAAQSSPSCAQLSASPSTGNGPTISPGVAGSDTSLYRVVTITQSAGSTCVYDYVERLALGAHQNSGSSLHSDLASVSFSGGSVSALTALPGAKSVPINPGATTAPSLAAAAGATQGMGNAWTVSTSSQPASLSMANTCDPDGRSQPIDVTVSWTHTSGAVGETSVVSSVYATNPTGRTLSIDATENLRDAAAAVVAHHSTGATSVPANSAHYLLATWTDTFPAGASTAYSTSVSGTFVDPITGQDAGSPQTASASHAVDTVTSTDNATAVITDTTGIAGSGLSYSVDSTTPSTGGFGAYVPGTATSAPVVWTSPSLGDSGSVVLHVTVTAAGAQNGTGTLSNTAALLGSSGLTTSSPLSVAVSTATQPALTISASIPDVLQGADTAAFSYTVTGPNGFTATPSLHFAAGDTSAATQLTGLQPGVYTVHQVADASGAWAAVADQTVDLGAACGGMASFSNTVVPAIAAVKKSTVPAGSEAGWVFTLVGPGTPVDGEQVTTTGAGPLAFATALQEGAYTVTESLHGDWVQTAANGCSFTVDYPADGGRTFLCDVTNTAVTSDGSSTFTPGPTPTPTPTSTPSATPTATPSDTPSATPGGDVGGVATPAPTNPAPGVVLPDTSGGGVLGAPNTGADVPYGAAGLLVLVGGGLLTIGWRRMRRRD